MNIQQVNVMADSERRLIANLIMSTSLMQNCYKLGKPDLFSQGVCRTVAGWLWQFYEKMGEAPKQAITDLYLQNASKLQPTESEMIKTFLSSLSDDWKPTNEPLIQDQALSFFRIQAVSQLKDNLDKALLVRDPAYAEGLIAQYVAPTELHHDSVSLLKEDSASVIANAFSDEEETLFTFPGDAGKVMGNFAVEDFVAFGAPPKRGKTWWLMKLATQAVSQGLPVLFISLEMKKAQVVRRFWQALTGCSRHGETAPWPTFKETSPGMYSVEYGTRATPQVNTDIAVIQQFQRNMSLYFKGQLEIKTYPSDSLTLATLRQDLKDLEVYEHFTPVVIVVDYADIMAHGSSRQEERDRLNTIWCGLRGLASERKCLIATATQTGRSTVSGNKDADESDVSEDIRKLGHVTKMLMINQSRQEQAQGIYRLSCNTTRDEAVVADQLVCASCLAIGDPMIDAKLLSKVDMQIADDTAGEPSRGPSKHKGFNFNRKDY